MINLSVPLMTTMKSSGASLERLLAQDDIYLGEYSGWYVFSFRWGIPLQKVSLRKFSDEAEMWQRHRSIRSRSGMVEESYLCASANTKHRLVEFFKSHPDFITPDGRLNEMLRVTSSSQAWKTKRFPRTTHSGIPVPSNPKHVVYVWIDALSRLVTALVTVKNL